MVNHNEGNGIHAPKSDKPLKKPPPKSKFISHKDDNIKFVTKDSGERVEFESGMQRDTNNGKLRYDLITPVGWVFNMIDRWAALMTRGAEKYDARNWEKASTKDELKRFLDSADRHFNQWKKEILCGTSDGEDHAAAILFNVQGVEYTKWKIEQDLR